MAFTEEDINHIKTNAKDWELEDGFACSHRRQKQYFVQPANKKEKITWKLVHGKYKQYCADAKTNHMSYSRWLQYVRYIFPGLRTTRSQEDLCDVCEEIKILLENSDISDDHRQELEALKHTHLDEAITQRRAMQAFIREFAQKLDPNLQLPAHIIPDVLEDDEEVLKIEAEIAENVSEENEIPDVEIVAVANDDSPQTI